MSEQEQEQPVSFVDARGRTWTPRMDCRVVLSFERKAGVGLFETVFEVMGETADGQSQRQSMRSKRDQERSAKTEVARTQQVIMQLASKLFGKMDSLMHLLYEGCRPMGRPSESPEWKGSSVAYADFCAAIGKAEISAAMSVAIVSLFNFFPELEETEGEGKSGDTPFAHTLGGMFMNSQGLPA